MSSKYFRVIIFSILFISLCLFDQGILTDSYAAEIIQETPLYKAEVLNYNVEAPLSQSCCKISARFRLDEFLGTKPFTTVGDTIGPLPINNPEQLVGKEIDMDWQEESKEQLVAGDNVYIYLTQFPNTIGNDHSVDYVQLGLTKQDPRPGDPSVNFQVSINDFTSKIHPKNSLTYKIIYKNSGNLILDEVKLAVLLYPWIQPTSFSIAPVVVGNEKRPIIEWSLGRVNPQQSGAINFNLTVPDNLVYPDIDENRGLSSAAWHQIVPMELVFYASVDVFSQSNLIAFASDKNLFVEPTLTAFHWPEDKGFILRILFFFAGGMVLQAWLLVRHKFSWSNFLGCIAAAILVFIVALMDGSISFITSLGMSLFIFALAFGFLFKKEILPEINELTLLSITITTWYLLMTVLKIAPLIRNYYALIALLPTTVVVVNSLLIRQPHLVEKIIMYGWHLILNIFFVIFFSFKVLQQYSLDEIELLILGMNSLYFVINQYYFLELILPLTSSSKGLGNKFKEWKENIKFIAGKFSNEQIQPGYAILLILLQGGVLILNLWKNLVPEIMILNVAFLIPQVVGHLTKPRYDNSHPISAPN